LADGWVARMVMRTVVVARIVVVVREEPNINRNHG